MTHGFDLSACWIQKAEQDLGDDDLWLSIVYYHIHQEGCVRLYMRFWLGLDTEKCSKNGENHRIVSLKHKTQPAQGRLLFCVWCDTSVLAG